MLKTAAQKVSTPKWKTILRAIALNGMAVLNLWAPMIPAKPKEIAAIVIATIGVLESKRVFELDPNEPTPEDQIEPANDSR